MYYFAYGSNMDSCRLWCRVQQCRGEDYAVAARKAANPERAILSDYHLSFSKPARRNPTREGYADIRPDASGKVEGVVYAVQEDVLDILDCYERTYKRTSVTVTLPLSGQQVQAVTYKGRKCEEGLRPSAQYMWHLITGATEHHLDTAWVDMLCRVETLNPPDAEDEQTCHH